MARKIDERMLRTPRLELGDDVTYLERDGSGNLALIDTVVGTKTVKQLLNSGDALHQAAPFSPTAQQVRDSSVIFAENTAPAAPAQAVVEGSNSETFSFSPGDSLIILIGSSSGGVTQVTVPDWDTLPGAATAMDVVNHLSFYAPEVVGEVYDSDKVRIKPSIGSEPWIAISDLSVNVDTILGFTNALQFVPVDGDPAYIETGAQELYDLTDGDTLEYQTDQAADTITFNESVAGTPAILDAFNMENYTFDPPGGSYDIDTDTGPATITIPDGTYTAANLAIAWQSELDGAGIAVTASDNGGILRLETNTTGVGAFIEISIQSNPIMDPLWNDAFPQQANGGGGGFIPDIDNVTAAQIATVINNFAMDLVAWSLPKTGGATVLIARAPIDAPRDMHTLEVTGGTANTELSFPLGQVTGTSGTGGPQLLTLPDLTAADDGKIISLACPLTSNGDVSLSGTGGVFGVLNPGTGITFVWDGIGLEWVQIN